MLLYNDDKNYDLKEIELNNYKRLDSRSIVLSTNFT